MCESITQDFMTTLSDKVSFKLGISKKTFRLLTHYLRLFEKWGEAKLVCLREKEDELVYWLKNGLCYYTVTVSCWTEIVKLSEIYYSVESGKYMSRELVKGPGPRRGTHLRMLRKMVAERGFDRTNSVYGIVDKSMKTIEKKPIPAKIGSEIATAPKAEDSEGLFVRLLGHALQGLLASNVYWDDAQLDGWEMYTPEEIVQKAWDYAEQLTWDIEDRREVVRFENKKKEIEE